MPGLWNNPKQDKRGRQKIPHQRVMSALKGFAKTGGSVNRVISRNGGWGCYAGSGASKCIHKTGTWVWKPLLQRQKQLSGRLLCVSLASRAWEGGTGTRDRGAIWKSSQRFLWMSSSFSPLHPDAFFPAFSVPWWNIAILFHSLSSNSWVREAGRASLKQVAILGSVSLARARVTHYKYGCWFNEGAVEKGRVIIKRENAPKGVS